MRAQDLALALFVISIWGLNFVVVKTGVTEIPPFLFMALRFAVVALLLVPFITWPAGKFWPLLAYSLVLGVGHFATMFSAIALTDSATIALLSQLNTPFAVILAAVIYRDYPGWRRCLGIAIAFIGCAVIAGEPNFKGGLLPVFLVVIGTFLWAVSAVQVKALGDVNHFALNGWMALMATPPLFAIAFFTESLDLQILSGISWLGWGTVLFQSIMVVIVGYGIWYGLLKKYPISRVIPLTLLLPIFGVAGGTLILGEALTSFMVVGGILVTIGVAIITFRQVRKAAQHQPKSPQ